MQQLPPLQLYHPVISRSRRIRKAGARPNSRGIVLQVGQGHALLCSYGSMIKPRSTATAAGQKTTKGRGSKKDLPPAVSGHELDDELFSAVSAVLSRFNGATEPTRASIAENTSTSAGPSVPPSTSVSQPTDTGNSTVIQKKLKPAKSRLSASWVPEDPEATSSLPVDLTTSAALQPLAINGIAVCMGSISRDLSPEVPTPSVSATIPAGSEIFEVAVQGQDEGSSSDSNSSDPEDEASPFTRAKSTAHTSASATSQYLSEAQVESLLRGPMPRKGLLAMLPSETSSEEERSDSGSEVELLASEQEEKQEQAYKRFSKRLERQTASSDEESVGDAGSFGGGEVLDRAVSAPPEVESFAEGDKPVRHLT
jgi:hypothetical protein